MRPEVNGRYCAKCDYKVVDFTQSTAEEIETAVRNAEGLLCGRFHVAQISRHPFSGTIAIGEGVGSPLPPTASRPKGWKSGAAAAVAMAAVSAFAATPADLPAATPADLPSPRALELPDSTGEDSTSTTVLRVLVLGTYEFGTVDTLPIPNANVALSFVGSDAVFEAVTDSAGVAEFVFTQRPDTHLAVVEAFETWGPYKHDTVSLALDTLNFVTLVLDPYAIGEVSQGLESRMAVSVSPNPAKDALTMYVESPCFQQAELALISVSGHAVYAKSYPLFRGTNELGADFSHLPRGGYVLTLRYGKRQESVRVVLE